MRARVPVPREPLLGNVELSASLVIAPEVDPEYPGAYTRSGLEVAFRPDSTKFTEYEDGRRSAHPQAEVVFLVLQHVWCRRVRAARRRSSSGNLACGTRGRLGKLRASTIPVLIFTTITGRREWPPMRPNRSRTPSSSAFARRGSLISITVS